MNTRRQLRRFLAIVFGMVVVGCVSPPHYAELGSKNSPMFGYTETRSGDGAYVLKTVYPNAGMAQNFWSQRARELCGGKDFDTNIFRQERPTVHYDIYGGRPGYFVLEGFLNCRDDDVPALVLDDASEAE